MANLTPVELTERMLGLLDKGGWIKKDFSNRAGYCLIGSMEALLGVDLRTEAHFLVLPFFLRTDKIASLHAVLRQVVEEINAEVFDEFDATELVQAIIAFNDDPVTTDEDLRLVL